MRRVRRRFFGVILSAGFGSVSALAQPMASVHGMPEDLLPELRPILRNAVQRSPQMIANDITLAQAQAARIRTDAALWPVVSAGISYGVSTAAAASGGITTPSSSTGLTYSVSLGQPIFHWGALKAGVEVGRIALKIAERQYAEGYRLLLGTIRTQYLALIAKKSSVRYAREALKQSEALLATAEARYQDGTMSAGELAIPRLAAADARLNADRLGLDFDSSKRLFARLAGLEKFEDADIPNDLPAPKFSATEADELLRLFLKDGPGATNQGQIYVMNIRQADLNYRIVKTSLYPKFSFAASTSLSVSTSASPGVAVSQSNVTSNYYGLSVGWLLFDGFATRGAKMSALATRRSSQRALDVYGENTVENLQNLHKQLQLSAKALDIAEQRHGLAASGSAVVVEDFKLGVASQTAHDAAVNSLLGADITRIYARSDYLTRWADFVSQTGADPAMNNLPARHVRSTK